MVIRTVLVELSSLEAVAYRQTLGNGKSGEVILRYDTAQPGLALLNRHTGEPDMAAISLRMYLLRGKSICNSPHRGR